MVNSTHLEKGNTDYEVLTTNEVTLVSVTEWDGEFNIVNEGEWKIVGREHEDVVEDIRKNRDWKKDAEFLR